MSLRRVFGAVGAAGLLLALGSAGTSLAQGTQGTATSLTATPAAITVTILAHHSVQPVSVAITASAGIPISENLGATMLGDLVRDDSAARVPRSAVQVSVTRDATDTSNETFVLTLTPNLKGIDPGKYSGNIRVEGPRVNPLVMPITLSIQGGSWWGALFLLLIGLLVGWLLKWYTDAGSKLVSETHRYGAVRRKLGDTPTTNMPKFVVDELNDVAQGLQNADQQTVDTALTALEGQVASLPAVTDVVAHIRNAIQAHASEIQRQGLPYGLIPTHELDRLNDALNEAPDLATARTNVSNLLTHANAITACLQNTADPGHTTPMGLYNQDLFDQALDAFQHPPASLAPAAEAAPAGGAAPAATGGGPADPRRLQQLLDRGRYLEQALAAPVGGPLPVSPTAPPQPRGWLAALRTAWLTSLRWLPLAIGVITVVIIALIGLKSQWSSNVTFGSGGVIDDVALFLWGVAAFVTGKTLSDFLSTIVSQ